MANSNKNYLNIEPLNGSNYHAWKFRVITLLSERGVMERINNEFKEEAYTDLVKREEAKRQDETCKSIIVQCIDDNQIDIVKDEKTAFAMWENLKEIYEKRGLPGQIFLRKRLMGMKLKEGESMQEFILKFEETLRQLKTSGVEIKEEDAVCSLLLSLPKSYETVTTVLENMPAESLTFGFVKSKLRAEEEKRKIDNSGGIGEASYPSAFISYKHGSCFNCGKQGHFIRDCKKRYKQESRNFESCRGMPKAGQSRGAMYEHNAGRGTRNSYPRNFRGRGRGYQNSPGRSYGEYKQRDREQEGNYTEYEQRKEERERDDICFMVDNYKNQSAMEICIDSLESARNAVDGGATRLEVCAALSEGGLTPSAGLVRVIRSTWTLPIYAMIRARSGNFVYTEEEMNVMLYDVKILKDLGADGFVFGALDEDDEIDAQACRRILTAAHPLPVTFHRAFDYVAEPAKALERLIELGFERVLTSGQKDTAEEGLELLADLVRRAGDRISVMPGSGITKDNIRAVKLGSGAKEYHASAKSKKVSFASRRMVKIGAGAQETYTMVADRELVKSMVDIIEEM